MNKPVTIKDIAQKVGVSETTISRYLNQKYEYMSEKTRDKIATVIQELDYRPNHMARSLKSQKSRMIGAVIADIENPFSAMIIKGLSDKCEALDYTLLIAISDNSAANERKQIEKLLDNQVDGLIINTSGDNEDYLLVLNDSGFPMILLDRGVSQGKIDTVTTDNQGAVQDMLAFLVDEGFRSIGFFSDELSNTVRQERCNSFEKVMKAQTEKGLKGVVYLRNPAMDSELATALQDFYTYPAPRVIFGANSLMTLKLLELMKQANYVINQDFSICGFDDLAWAKVMTPALTTIHQNSYDLGVESLNQLVAKINQKTVEEAKITKLPAHLKIRESTQIKP